MITLDYQRIYKLYRQTIILAAEIDDICSEAPDIRQLRKAHAQYTSSLEALNQAIRELNAATNNNVTEAIQKACAITVS